MRIIGGELRGRKIVGTPKDPGVRPISGRMRQSTFDILRPRLSGSAFLDLFAGSGSVGLEALSRGARRAVFLEGDLRCVKGIERNLEHFGLAAKAEVHRATLPQGLVRVRGARFDIVFLGPPYKDKERRMLGLTAPTLEAVSGLGLLAPGGVAVAQSHKSEDPKAPKGLVETRSERYGDTVIRYYRREDDVPAAEAVDGDA